MSRPLRILRVITRLNVGGPTRHVAILMERLEAEGFHQVLAHGPAAPEEGEGVLEVPGEHRLVPTLGREIRPVADLRSLHHLRRLVRDVQPDVVHTHQGKAGLLGRLAAAREGVPLIVHTYHGHTFARYFGRVKGRLVLRAERAAAARSHRIVCQSESQAADVVAALGEGLRSRVRVIRPAADPRAWRLGAKETPEPRGGEPVILLLARLVAVKRPELLAEAFVRLRRRRPATLWVAGDGPLRSSMRAVLDRAHLSDAVRWLGHRRSPAPLLAAADLLVLPSAMEGTPQVLLEAMAAGTPLLATDVGGVRDVVGDAGTLLPFEADAAAWASRMGELLDEAPELRERRRALGRERAATLFSVDRLVAETAALYREALAEA